MEKFLKRIEKNEIFSEIINEFLQLLEKENYLIDKFYYDKDEAVKIFEFRKNGKNKFLFIFSKKIFIQSFIKFEYSNFSLTIGDRIRFSILNNEQNFNLNSKSDNVIKNLLIKKVLNNPKIEINIENNLINKNLNIVINPEFKNKISCNFKNIEYISGFHLDLWNCNNYLKKKNIIYESTIMTSGTFFDKRIYKKCEILIIKYGYETMFKENENNNIIDIKTSLFDPNLIIEFFPNLKILILCDFENPPISIPIELNKKLDQIIFLNQHEFNETFVNFTPMDEFIKKAE